MLVIYYTWYKRTFHNLVVVSPKCNKLINRSKMIWREMMQPFWWILARFLAVQCLDRCFYLSWGGARKQNTIYCLWSSAEPFQVSQSKILKFLVVLDFTWNNILSNSYMVDQERQVSHTVPSAFPYPSSPACLHFRLFLQPWLLLMSLNRVFY